MLTELLLCNFYWLLSNSSSIDWQLSIILINLILLIRDLISSSFSSHQTQREENLLYLFQ